jgi:hypothetical protein
MEKDIQRGTLLEQRKVSSPGGRPLYGQWPPPQTFRQLLNTAGQKNALGGVSAARATFAISHAPTWSEVDISTS